MTIQRRNRTRRLQLEPLEARDVPSAVSPHAGLFRPIARLEALKAAHLHVRLPRAHVPAAVPSTASAGAASSSISPAASSPAPITVVLGPTMQMVVTHGNFVFVSPPLPDYVEVPTAAESGGPLGFGGH